MGYQLGKLSILVGFGLAFAGFFERDVFFLVLGLFFAVLGGAECGVEAEKIRSNTGEG
tara:strand:- start:1023 stop:1196 length:174 start_codon:yes stop_codon:yes gene_type:complete